MSILSVFSFHRGLPFMLKSSDKPPKQYVEGSVFLQSTELYLPYEYRHNNRFIQYEFIRITQEKINYKL